MPWDGLWETAPQARVLQELGDLGVQISPWSPRGEAIWLGTPPGELQGGTHLLVGQHHQRQPGLLGQQRVQLLAGRQQALPVHGVHHEDQHVGPAQVMGPVRSQVLAATDCEKRAGSVPVHRGE